MFVSNQKHIRLSIDDGKRKITNSLNWADKNISTASNWNHLYILIANIWQAKTPNDAVHCFCLLGSYGRNMHESESWNCHITDIRAGYLSIGKISVVWLTLSICCQKTKVKIFLNEVEQYLFFILLFFVFQWPYSP